MSTGRPKVFISYSSKDRGYADRLVSSLLLNGVQVWYDQRDIDVGQNIHDKVLEGLLDVNFLAIVLTPRSLESAWVKEELSLAKQRELEENNVIILPLLFEQVTLPLHLRSRKYADFCDFDTGFSEMMRAINRRVMVNPFDYSLRQRVRETFSALGSGTAADIQTIRSQNSARLVRETALHPRQVASEFNSDAEVNDSSPAIIYVDIQSAGIVIPVRIDLNERSGSVLARVLRAVGLDQLVLERQQFSFFLVFENIPLELNERLADAGITDGVHLQLGAFTFLIE